VDTVTGDRARTSADVTIDCVEIDRAKRGKISAGNVRARSIQMVCHFIRSRVSIISLHFE
jgi:hypothetical protein